MSTSLLYHAFGIRGYEYIRTDYKGSCTIFTIGQDRESHRCSACGSPEVHSRGQVERVFRSLPIGGRATLVVLRLSASGATFGRVFSPAPRRAGAKFVCWRLASHEFPYCCRRKRISCRCCEAGP